MRRLLGANVLQGMQSRADPFKINGSMKGSGKHSFYYTHCQLLCPTLPLQSLFPFSWIQEQPSFVEVDGSGNMAKY